MIWKKLLRLMRKNSGFTCLIILYLIASMMSLSCGNLLNEQAMINPDLPADTEFTDRFFLKKISSVAPINLQTKYDEYAVSGSIINENNVENIWLSSLSPSGNTIFESTVRSDKHGRVSTLITDTDENYILICNEIDPVDFNFNILLLKMSPDKSVKWSSRIESFSSVFAISAAVLSDGRVAVIGQRKNQLNENYYEPILITFDPDNNSITSLKLEFTPSGQGDEVFPVPLKISVNDENTITIAGFYRNQITGKTCIAVVKLNSELNIIARYLLVEPSKHLTLIDMQQQNNNMDLFLICKSDSFNGKDEGFTLLKIFYNKNKFQKKFENDYLINGFNISDNLITNSNGELSVGGYIRTGTDQYSISILKFNSGGNIKDYIRVEAGIPEINKITFSQIENKNYFSYIYSCNKISDTIDGQLAIRKFYLSDMKNSITKVSDKSKSSPEVSEVLNPIEISEIEVSSSDINDITVNPDSNLDIKWE